MTRTFRGSGTGKCIKEIVCSHLDPESTKPPRDKEIFLAAGHDHQVTVTRALQEQGFLVSEVEAEVESGVGIPGVRAVGHMDGVIHHPQLGIGPELLEVKAVKAATFGILRRLGPGNWKTHPSFASYVAQMNGYMAMRGLTGSNLVVYNRNTSDIITPWKIDHPQFFCRPDLYLEFDPELWSETQRRLAVANQMIEDGTVPACDKQKCWFCGTATPRKGKKRTNTTTPQDRLGQLEKLSG